MAKSSFKKLDQVRSVAGYNKGFWTMILAAVFAAVCLIHIETSRAKQADNMTDNSKVTIERIPASEARHMGIEVGAGPRNN